MLACTPARTIESATRPIQRNGPLPTGAAPSGSGGTMNAAGLASSARSGVPSRVAVIVTVRLSFELRPVTFGALPA
jgi:hypothetical protein